jgi:hypothetical protein
VPCGVAGRPVCCRSRAAISFAWRNPGFSTRIQLYTGKEIGVRSPAARSFVGGGKHPRVKNSERLS